MATQTDIDAAKAAGYWAPTGDDLILDGDNAITENAVVAFLQRWPKGHAGVSGLDGFTTGQRDVTTGQQALDLGLPVGVGGSVETLRFGDLGLQTFETIEEMPTVWVRRRTSSGWQPWQIRRPKATFLTVAQHGAMTFDQLPDGPYFNTSATMADAVHLNLPVVVSRFQKDTATGGYGVAELTEWALPNRKWISRRTTGGWQPWELASGAGGSGVAITALAPDQDMANLTDGWWQAPSNGVALSLGLPGGLKGFLLQANGDRQYTNKNGVFVSTKGAAWGAWAQAGVEDGYTPLQPPTGLPWNQVDTDTFTGMMLDQDHHGDGYAINTQNWPGANSGWVGHQYSNFSPFAVLDNCGNKPMIQVNNTRNTTITPDSNGTGDMFRFSPWDNSATFPGENYARWFGLSDNLEFYNDTRKVPSFNQIFGTGDVLVIKVAGVAKGKFNRDGSYEALTADANPVLRSASGARFRLVVSDAGALSTVAL